MPRTKKILKHDEFQQGMSYTENSTLCFTDSSRTNLGFEKASKLAFLFKHLNAE